MRSFPTSLSERPIPWSLSSILWLGCQGTDTRDTDTSDHALQTCDRSEPGRIGAISKMVFGRATDDGISPGFNLDGEVTELGDPTGCGIPDFVSPRGEAGIDNALARLIPALEQTEAQAVEGILQQQINSGELVLVFEIFGIDDPVEDDCVSFSLMRAMGTPLLGTDGFLLSGQTFDLDPTQAPLDFDEQVITSGQLTVSPIEIVLPFTVFDANLMVEVHDATLQVELQEDGSFVGTLGGGLDTAYIIQIAREENVDPELEPLLEGLMAAAADLEPDDEGDCTQISISLELEAIPAFYFDD